MAKLLEAKYLKWALNRDRSFLNLLEVNPNAKVVDLGCGDGQFTMKIANYLGLKEIYGVDTWPRGIQHSQELGIKIVVSDLEKPLDIPSKSFDVVISNQVIEHLRDTSLFVKEIHRILKDDGYAVISTENLASWDNIIALLAGYTPFSVHYGKFKVGNPLSPKENEGCSEFPGHATIFSYVGLIEFLLMHSFSIEAISVTGHFISELFCNIDKKHCRFITVKMKKSQQ